MTNPFREKMIQGISKGDTFIFKRRFTREDTIAFGDLTLDYNPVHYDERWTDAKNFNGLICHGLLVGSMVCEFGGQVGWLASGMTFKFIRPVYFNDTITCTITLDQIDEKGRARASASFTNQDTEKVGYAELTGRLPRDKERLILKQMVKEGDPTNKLSEKQYTDNPRITGQTRNN